MGIFVTGGINLDIKAASSGSFQRGTSNPGTIWKTVGGVGRNIAHSLALLGMEVSLCSAVGDDSAGREILDFTASAGVDIRPVFRLRDSTTGTYLAIQDGQGVLIGAVSDMDAMTSLTPDILEKWSPELKKASCLVADTNLPIETLRRLADTSDQWNIPLLIEPVSIEKIGRIHYPDLTTAWITPNADELQALWSIPPRDWRSFESHLSSLIPDSTSPYRRPREAMTVDPSQLTRLLSHARPSEALGTSGILVTMGSLGVLLLSSEAVGKNPSPQQSRPDQHFQAVRDRGQNPSPLQARLFPALPAKVRDPNGAGDAFVAGFLDALYSDTLRLSVEQAIWYGQATAVLTLESEHTVNPNLSREAVLQRLALHNPYMPGGTQ